jgi:hypothetical protein
MHDKSHYLSVFLSLAAIVLAGTLASSAFAQEADPRALIERMGAEVAALDRFILSGEAYADASLGAGQIIQNSSEVTMQVQKPGSMHLTRHDTEDNKDLYFSGGVLSIYTESLKFYAQTNVPEGLGAAVDFAVEEIGIDAPLLDFVSNDMAETLMADADEVQLIGTSLVRGKLYEQIAIRTAEVDIQMWIASEGRPLPGKMVISSKWEGGSPRFVVFMEWNTNPEFPADTFNFVPPNDATKIDFITQP